MLLCVLVIKDGKDMIWKFSMYGFLKNLRFFEPFLYLFFLSRGLSFFHIGLLIGIRELTLLLMEVPTGVVADVLGKRRTMVSCFSVYIVSFILFYFGSDFFMFIPAFILFGTGEALRTGTHKAIIMDYLDRKGLSKEKTKYYGLTRSWSLFGSSISALLAGALVFFSNSYEYIFIASTIPYILGLLLMLSYPRNLDREISKDLRKVFMAEIIDHIRRMMISLRYNIRLLRSIVNSSIADAVFKISKDYIQPILQSYVLLAGGLLAGSLFISEKQEIAVLVGVSFFFIYIFSAISSRNAHRIEKAMVSRDRSIDILFTVFVIMLLVLGLFRSFELFLPIILIFVLMYMLINIRRPMLIGYIVDRTDRTQRASVLSIESQLKSFMIMVFAPILGFLAENLGVEYVFYGGAGLLIISMPFLILSTRRSQKNI